LSYYDQLGGEQSLRRLVDRFYDAMDELEVAATIRAMHPADMTIARQKLFEFLSGWLGGPNLYWERYGHPRLRRRHLHVAIDQRAADAWMACMYVSLDEVVVDDEALRKLLEQRLAQVAAHMMNR
jgi:hemoglobin